MIIFLYLAILILGSYWVIKTLAPEMAKPPIDKKAPAEPITYSSSQPNGPVYRVEKLEALLAEKNKNINLLQKELRIFYVQVQAFEKIKMLMEEEIYHLREQNQMFRSELGLPAVEAKQKSAT